MVHSEYGRLTANSCCCAACRDLGFFGFHLLREIVKLIFANLASEAPHFCSGKVVLERIDEQQRFCSNVYEAHLAAESSTADHCKQYLLTPISDGRWKYPCTHGRGDKQPVPVLQTHEDYIRESTGRDAKNSDWSAPFASNGKRRRRAYCIAVSTAGRQFTWVAQIALAVTTDLSRPIRRR